MKIPTPDQCLEYFETYKVPRNIYRHCLFVRDVAVFIASEMKKKNEAVNVELVHALALCHDLFKVVTFEELKKTKFHSYDFSQEEIDMWKKLREKYAGKYEGEIAYDVFKDDFPEFALAIKRASDPHFVEKTTEEAIVHYADWRVFKEKVVSIQTRLNYLREAYPRDKEAWDKYYKRMRGQEEMIFSDLTFDPDQLGPSMEAQHV